MQTQNGVTPAQKGVLAQNGVLLVQNAVMPAQDGVLPAQNEALLDHITVFCLPKTESSAHRKGVLLTWNGVLTQNGIHPHTLLPAQDGVVPA